LIFIFLKSTFTMYRKLGNRIKYWKKCIN
jgi:hypothetical protein